MTTEAYSDRASHRLAQAHEELAKGDLTQASEKGWGAVAQMVKAAAVRRGWEHQSHAALYRVVSRLVAETGDDTIHTLFGVANGLHANFYENWSTAEGVASGISDVARFLDKLRPLVD